MMGYVFIVAEGLVSWKTELKDTMGLSTTEVEYTTAVKAFIEALWLIGLIDIFEIIQDSVQIYCDSQSAIRLAKNHIYHKRTKHIDVRII